MIGTIKDLTDLIEDISMDIRKNNNIGLIIFATKKNYGKERRMWNSGSIF